MKNVYRIVQLMMIAILALGAGTAAAGTSQQATLSNGDIICYGPYLQGGEKKGLAVVRYNSLNQVQWVQFITGLGEFLDSDLVIINDEIFVSGVYTDMMNIEFIPGVVQNPVSQIYANGDNNTFVVKFDEDGSPGYVADLDGPENVMAHSLITLNQTLKLVYSISGELEFLTLSTADVTSMSTSYFYSSMGYEMTLVMHRATEGDPGGVYPGDTTLPVPNPIPTSD